MFCLVADLFQLNGLNKDTYSTKLLSKFRCVFRCSASVKIAFQNSYFISFCIVLESSEILFERVAPRWSWLLLLLLWNFCRSSLCICLADLGRSSLQIIPKTFCSISLDSSNKYHTTSESVWKHLLYGSRLEAMN